MRLPWNGGTSSLRRCRCAVPSRLNVEPGPSTSPSVPPRAIRSVPIVKSSLTSTGSLITTALPKIGRLRVNSEPWRRATAATALSRAVMKPMPCTSFGIRGAGGSRTGSVVTSPMMAFTHESLPCQHLQSVRISTGYGTPRYRSIQDPLPHMFNRRRQPRAATSSALPGGTHHDLVDVDIRRLRHREGDRVGDGRCGNCVSAVIGHDALGNRVGDGAGKFTFDDAG